MNIALGCRRSGSSSLSASCNLATSGGAVHSAVLPVGAGFAHRGEGDATSEVPVPDPERLPPRLIAAPANHVVADLSPCFTEPASSENLVGSLFALVRHSFLPPHSMLFCVLPTPPARPPTRAGRCTR